jgi:hypothetical protein
MTFVTLLAVWTALGAAGIAAVYSIGLRLERRSPALSLAVLVLLAPAVLIASWMAAHKIVRVDQATCEEKDPAAGRLSGMSPTEFRVRCMATKDVSEWLRPRL